MSATHYLRHLSLAYHYFHPVDEHFAQRMDFIERKRLRGQIMAHLGVLETKTAMALSQNRSEALYRILYRIKALKAKVELR